MIKGVIFDLDGVIVSTDSLHYNAWKAIADQEGIEFDKEFNNQLRGVSRMESLNLILSKGAKPYSDEEKVMLAEQKNNIYVESIKTLSHDSLLLDVEYTINYLKNNGYKIAVGSSSKNTKTILKQIGLLDSFDFVADGNMILHSKPDPEVFIKAAEGLGLAPNETIVIEDAIAGIKAANAGGMVSCGIGDASNYDKAVYRINSVKEVISLL